MKTIKTLSTFGLAVLLVLTSCTMEKRLYMPGYHVEWSWKNHTADKKELVWQGHIMKQEAVEKVNDEIVHRGIKAETSKSGKSLNEATIAAATATAIIQQPKTTLLDVHTKPERKNPNKDEECDILTLRNGYELKVKVIEIGTSEIRYKRCDNLQGPTIVIRKSEVFSIKYPNGTKDVISASGSTKPDISSSYGDKSFAITLILWFFLGLLGIHRFYLGHIGMGVLYLLTGALCGIGWIIDLILLLTGGLKPRNGELIQDL